MKPRISYDTNQRLPIVAKVIKADLAFITGKIETKARFLGMRPAGLLPSLATILREV